MESRREMVVEDHLRNWMTEDLDWAAMPFVRSRNGKILDNWAPIETNDYFAARQYGVHCAERMILHLRKYQVFDDVDELRWSGVTNEFRAQCDHLGAGGLLDRIAELSA